MNDEERMNLHDGIVKSMKIDFYDCSVEIDLMYYDKSAGEDRRSLKINITNVRNLAVNCDVRSVRNMAGFGGNINDWSGQVSPKFALDLMGGYIFVDSTE